MRFASRTVLICALLATLLPQPAAASIAATCETTTALPREPGSRHPVVLVHGWNGGPSGMSRAGDAIASALKGRVEIYAFDYHRHSDNWAADDEVSGCLAAFIDAISRSSAGHGGDGKVYLVGHSMGGLAIRYASARTIDGRRVGDEIGGVVTLDTPHLGSYWGGSWYGKLVTNTLGALSREWAPMPSPESDATRCLAHHEGGATFPSACGSTPPYLPRTAPLQQISGQVSVTRTFLGIPLYTYSMDGDSIVDTSSEGGYIYSGPTKKADYGPAHITQVPCTIEAGQLIALATANKAPFLGLVIEGVADVGVDNAAMDDIGSGRVGPALAAMLIVANVFAGCSHLHITSEPQALKATTDQLTEWMDTVDNPPLAFTGAKGFTVVHGSKVVATQPPGDCGALYSYFHPPIWSRDGHYAASVWSACEDDGIGPPSDDDNIVFVIDRQTGKRRHFLCGCQDIVALDGSKITWVNDHGRIFTADLAGTGGGTSRAVALPSGYHARTAVSGVGGMLLLQATRTPPGADGYRGREESGPGAMLLVDAAGKVTVAREYPELNQVYAAAANATTIAYSPIEVFGDCAHPGEIWLLDVATGRHTATDTSALRRDKADVFMRDAWWGVDGKLYGTLASSVCNPEGGAVRVAPSLWRLDGTTWVRARDGEVSFVRAFGQVTMVVDDSLTLYLERAGKRTKVSSDVYAIESPPLPLAP
jgi:pimeloyl-ACP methyl ester carboxylesterase